MTQEYASKTIEHLGLVNAMYDELGISEVINQTIKQDLNQRTINLGQLLKAILDHKTHLSSCSQDSTLRAVRAWPKTCTLRAGTLAGMVAGSKRTGFHTTTMVLNPPLFQW